MQNTTYARIGEIVFTDNTEENLMAVALGSCVGVALYDATAGLAGLGHIALPNVTEKPKRVSTHDNFKLLGRYAETAIPFMLEQLQEHGGSVSRIQAKLAGGGSVFGTRGLIMGSILNIGQRNGKRILELLKKYNIPVVGKDLGGDIARTVTFSIRDYNLIITNSTKTMNKVI